jgi:tetratricopeptide (TPR) repeat protein
MTTPAYARCDGHRRYDLRRALLGALLMLASACDRGRGPAAAARSTSSAEPAQVEWAGCAVVRVGPRCELGRDRSLVVWSPAPDAGKWRFATDRGPLPAARTKPLQGGTQAVVDVPAGAHAVRAEDAAGREVWSLVIGEAAPHADIDNLLAAGKAGKSKESAARLQQIIAAGPQDARGPAEAAYARIQLALGNVEEAEPAFRRSMAAARAEGRLSDVVRDGVALVWGLTELRQRFTDARAVLASLTEPASSYPQGRATLSSTRGMLASLSGDLRDGLQSYRNAAQDFERLGDQQRADLASEDVARLLTSIGRAEEAVSILEQLAAKTDPCKRATTAINRAEALMEARNLDASPGDDRVRDAVQAAEAAARACPDPHRRLVAGTYALAFALDTRDDATADRFAGLLEKTELRSDALAASWRGGVLGRWALERGRAADALTLFDEQISIARAAGLEEEALRGHIGAGRALLALRRAQPAVTHFLAAERLLVHALEGVPLMEGRGEFLRGHDQAVRYLVDALVDQRRTAEALRVARTSRAAELASAARLQRLERLSPEQRRRWDEAVERYLRGRRALEHEAEDDWKFPRNELADRRAAREIRAKNAQAALDDAYRLLGAQDFAHASPLRPLAATEVELLLFPGPPEQKRWTVFVRAGDRTRAVRVPARALASNREAGAVLDAVSQDLERAERVRILAYGDADRVDWHVVSWRGEPLIRKLEVAYALDVSAPEQAATAPAAPQALLVLDPTADLPQARIEGDVVGHALQGWKLTRLTAAGATRDAVLSALSAAGLLHYAGHTEIGGPSGMSSALLVAGGARIELGDLLAAPRLPSVVVLSACEAAASAQASMMGLAQAFLISGTHAAVAATRPVPDQSARAFMSAFYENLKGIDAASMARAYRQAAVSRLDDTGSQSFRLVLQ